MRTASNTDPNPTPAVPTTVLDASLFFGDALATVFDVTVSTDLFIGFVAGTR